MSGWCPRENTCVRVQRSNNWRSNQLLTRVKFIVTVVLPPLCKRKNQNPNRGQVEMGAWEAPQKIPLPPQQSCIEGSATSLLSPLQSTFSSGSNPFSNLHLFSFSRPVVPCPSFVGSLHSGTSSPRSDLHPTVWKASWDPCRHIRTSF
jgi:hypothetical protein